MKDLKFKIIVLLLTVSIVFNIGFCFVISDKNKEIQNEKSSYANKIDALKEKSEKQEAVEPEKHPIDIKVEKCMEGCNYTTSCMTNCVYGSINDWEQISKESLQELKEAMDNEQYELLLDSQNLWEKHKEAEIKFLNATVGSLQGSIYSNILSAQIADIYKQRAQNLSGILYLLKQ